MICNEQENNLMRLLALLLRTSCRTDFDGEWADHAEHAPPSSSCLARAAKRRRDGWPKQLCRRSEHLHHVLLPVPPVPFLRKLFPYPFLELGIFATIEAGTGQRSKHAPAIGFSSSKSVFYVLLLLKSELLQKFAVIVSRQSRPGSVKQLRHAREPAGARASWRETGWQQQRRSDRANTIAEQHK